MREFLQGRRFGFALRPPLATVALGLGIAVSLLDLMAWFGWGARSSNGFVVAAYWLSAATAVVGILGLAAAAAELMDVPDADRSLARLDVLGIGVATLLYIATAVARSFDLGAAAAPPPVFLLAIAALVVLVAGSAMASLLYAAREWEEIEEVAHVPQRRRRTAS